MWFGTDPSIFTSQSLLPLSSGCCSSTSFECCRRMETWLSAECSHKYLWIFRHGICCRVLWSRIRRRKFQARQGLVAKKKQWSQPACSQRREMTYDKSVHIYSMFFPDLALLCLSWSQLSCPDSLMTMFDFSVSARCKFQSWSTVPFQWITLNTLW